MATQGPSYFVTSMKRLHLHYLAEKFWSSTTYGSIETPLPDYVTIETVLLDYGTSETAILGGVTVGTALLDEGSINLALLIMAIFGEPYSVGRYLLSRKWVVPHTSWKEVCDGTRTYCISLKWLLSSAPCLIEEQSDENQPLPCMSANLSMYRSHALYSD